MDKFQFLAELSARDTPIFRFRNITSVKINEFSLNLINVLIFWNWFGIVNGHISLIFDRIICPPHVRMFVAGR